VGAVAVPIKITDRSGEANARYREASRMGMDAAANHLRVSVVKAFGSWYYKGGAFRSTLQVKQSIRRVGPFPGRDGWEAQVGTNKIEALYWELGHRNLFTRKFERVEIWVPTAVQEVGTMQATFGRVVARYMNRK
jgi:hypothetical protein